MFSFISIYNFLAVRDSAMKFCMQISDRKFVNLKETECLDRKLSEKSILHLISTLNIGTHSFRQIVQFQIRRLLKEHP